MFQSDYFNLASLALQIIHIVPTYHYTAKTRNGLPIKSKNVSASQKALFSY